MIRICLSIVVVFGLAGCDELSGHDDPRASDGFTYDGDCTGFALQCEQLDEDGCAAMNGCTWGPGCFETEQRTCFSRTDETTCETGSAPFCTWEEGQSFCYPYTDVCNLDDNQSSCQSDPIGCSWGFACTGVARASCFNLSGPANCESVPGCEWH